MVGNIRIPKRVGAVKLPKKVRRKAKKAIKAAASPFVRDFATAAMAAAGRAQRGTGGERAREPGARLVGGEADFQIDGNKVVEAIRTAAIDGFRRFLEGLEQGLRDVEAEAGAKDDPQPEPQARPKKAARPRAAAKPKPAAKPRARKAPPGTA